MSLPLDPSKPLEGNAVAYFTVGGGEHETSGAQRLSQGLVASLEAYRLVQSF
jgi:hypothetical protein